MLTQTLDAGLFVRPRRGQLCGPQRIPPQHIAYAFLLDLADLGRKQLHLQHARRQQGLDLGLGDRRNVVEARGGEILHLAAFNHPPVTHKRHLLTTETLAGFLHLGGEGLGVLRVAPEDFAGERHALLVAQQADDNLLLPLLAVPGVAIGPVGIPFTFQITARHVVEKQARFLLAAPAGEQPVLDPLLMLAEPSQVGVEVVLIEAALQAQHIAGGMDLGQPHRGQARALIEHASQNLPQRQLRREAGAEGVGDAEPPGHLGDRPHGAERKPLRQVDLVEGAKGGQITLVLQRQLEGSNLLGISMGEVGDVAFANVRALAVRLAEVDGLINFAVGGRPGSPRYIHDHIIYEYYHFANDKFDR